MLIPCCWIHSVDISAVQVVVDQAVQEVQEVVDQVVQEVQEVVDQVVQEVQEVQAVQEVVAQAVQEVVDQAVQAVQAVQEVQAVQAGQIDVSSTLVIRSTSEVQEDVSEMLAVVAAAGVDVLGRLDVSHIEQSGLKLSDLFEPVPEHTPLRVSGPLPKDILNTLEMLSRESEQVIQNISEVIPLPPSPRVDVNALYTKDAVVQTSVSVDRLIVPVLR